MYEWHIRDRVLHVDPQVLVMGIVNVTPDSFSDGGQHLLPAEAIAHGLELVRQGADILDVGGESTRPGAPPVALDEELRRVLPVVKELAGRTDVPLSIDTYKAGVADACLAAGAHIVNDITALQGDKDMASVVAHYRAGVVLMHMQGTPATMQQAPHYQNVVDDVRRYLEERLHAAEAVGISRDHVIVDPGIGFGKTGRHNLELIARLDEFQSLGRPVCLGVSRKAFIGKILGQKVTERLISSLVVACHAIVQRSAQVVRVHDVQPTREAVMLLTAIREQRAG